MDEYIIGNTKKSLVRQKKFKDVINVFSSHILINHCVNEYKVFLNHRIYIKDYPFNPTYHKPLRVIHAASHPEAKGTNLVLEAVKGLPIEFLLVTDTPNDECIDLVNQSDVCIGQMVWGENGMQEVEAMAMGKPTLCNIIHDKTVGVYKCKASEIQKYIDLFIRNKINKELATLSRYWVEENCLPIDRLLMIYRQAIGMRKSFHEGNEYLNLMKERYLLMPELEFKENENKL